MVVLCASREARSRCRVWGVLIRGSGAPGARTDCAVFAIHYRLWRVGNYNFSALEKYLRKGFRTLLGELIVSGKRGLIGETISIVSICLPFHQEGQT